MRGQEIALGQVDGSGGNISVGFGAGVGVTTGGVIDGSETGGTGTMAGSTTG